MHNHIKKLMTLPYDVWYNVKSKNGDDLTEIIKELIDSGEQFEFSNDYKKFRRLENIFWK